MLWLHNRLKSKEYTKWSSLTMDLLKISNTIFELNHLNRGVKITIAKNQKAWPVLTLTWVAANISNWKQRILSYLDWNKTKARVSGCEQNQQNDWSFEAEIIGITKLKFSFLFLYIKFSRFYFVLELKFTLTKIRSTSSLYDFASKCRIKSISKTKKLNKLNKCDLLIDAWNSYE